VKQANDYLDEAESFMRSIAALKEHLEAAKRDVQTEIVAAQAEVSAAWQYIKTYDDDIKESLEGDLRSAQSALESAAGELQEDKPDYLKVLKLAQQANAATDAILAEAREEHETTERLRVKAPSAVRDARAAVSKAKEYVEDHAALLDWREQSGLSNLSVDNGPHAKDASNAAIMTAVQHAEGHLQQAEETSNLAEKVSEAETAEAMADDAYRTARGAVEDSFSRFRGREPIGGAVGVPFGIGRWGGGWGGGESFGGGGGSSGFGGSGGRGGGSSGW
jgi:hypothetical protein